MKTMSNDFDFAAPGLWKPWRADAPHRPSNAKPQDTEATRTGAIQPPNRTRDADSRACVPPNRHESRDWGHSEKAVKLFDEL
jgi:hypothetical protein